MPSAQATRTRKQRKPDAQRPRPTRKPGAPFALTPRDLAEPLPTLLDTEWLLPDGVGGYAMGTAAGANTRRYHGLYVPALRPPLDRNVALSNIVETLSFRSDSGQEERIDLSTFRFGGGVVHPRGADLLVRFERAEGGGECRWTWEVRGVRVVRAVRPIWGRGGVVIRYTLTPIEPVNADDPPVRLELRPLVALRDAHHTLRRADADFDTAPEGVAGAVVSRHGLGLRLIAEGARYVSFPDWWTNFFYDREAERHYEANEDLFNPGVFTAEASTTGRGRGSFDVAILAEMTTAPRRAGRPLSIARGADKRAVALRALTRKAPPVLRDPAVGPLLHAADDFLVPRTVGRRRLLTILAGYPWFADWGRDALICVPGLAAMGRQEEARQALQAFAGHVRDGLVPNRFDDATGEPDYNAADASFWFLRAAAELASGARKPDPLLKPCLAIIEAIRAGAPFNIGVDPADALVYAGDESTQLTWMDAKRDGVVFTPRHGKPVEINALWVHSLTALARLLPASERRRRKDLADLARAAGDSMRRLFWLPDAGHLADTLRPSTPGRPTAATRWTPTTEFRPNQVIAIALEHAPFTSAQRRSILDLTRQRLLTPFGLRTLAPGSPDYQPRYEGPMFDRDRAYHNGTVWPWLLGFYCEALLRAGKFSASSRREARRALGPILDSLRSGCLGQIAEVYDADEPQRPDGCPAQAWSVYETARALTLIGPTRK